MMFVKLILRNLKRSTKEYAIYLMTLVIAVMLMYAFNGVSLSSEIQELSKHMDSLFTMVVGSSIVIVFVLGWLIYYISNFILQKRSREFGMYMLMGMSRKEVSRMFLLEQICMGVLAIVIGCMLGTLVYQLIQAIIMNMFQRDYSFSISFSSKGAGLTILYFIGMYALELLRERHYLKKHSIHDLMYNERKNQKMKRNKKLSVFMVLIGIVMFLLGLKELDLSMANQMAGLGFIASIFLIIASIFCFYFGLSYVISDFFHKHKKLKYRGNTLYLSAQICTRLQTGRMVLSLLSILTLATLMLVSVGLKFNESEKASQKLMVYDIVATSYSENTLNKQAIYDYMEKNEIAYKDHSYVLYAMSYPLKPLLEGTNQEADYGSVKDFSYIRYSDYCSLMKLLNHQPQSLSEGEYLLITDVDFKDRVRENAKDFTIGGLRFKGVDTHEIGQSRYDVFWVVLPDQYVTDAEIKTNEMYVLKSETPSNQDWVEQIEQAYFQDNHGYGSFYIKYDWMMSNLTSVVLIVFVLIYIAIILACVNATVLAIHQMSDAWKQKDAYQMLNKMGVSRRELHRLLRRQIGIYFFVPFLIPVLYAFPIIAVVNRLFMLSYARASMFPYVIASIAFYLVIYLCYYLLAYFNSKHSIENT